MTRTCAGSICGLSDPGSTVEGDPNQRGNAGRGLTRSTSTQPKEQAVPKPTQPRLTVRQSRTDRTWHVSCPCGYTWRTRWHRLAVLFALNHLHREVA